MTHVASKDSSNQGLRGGTCSGGILRSTEVGEDDRVADTMAVKKLWTVDRCSMRVLPGSTRAERLGVSIARIRVEPLPLWTPRS